MNERAAKSVYEFFRKENKHIITLIKDEEEPYLPHVLVDKIILRYPSSRSKIKTEYRNKILPYLVDDIYEMLKKVEKYANEYNSLKEILSDVTLNNESVMTPREINEKTEEVNAKIKAFIDSEFDINDKERIEY